MSYQYPFTLAEDDFTEDGFHKSSNEFFMNMLTRWEHSFKLNCPNYANCLLANSSVMMRISKYIGMENEYRLGMDLVDDKIDIDANLEVEQYSQHKTVYAIGSTLPGNIDEPIWLIVVDDLPKDQVILKYMPDDDDDAEEELPDNSPVLERELINS